MMETKMHNIYEHVRLYKTVFKNIKNVELYIVNGSLYAYLVRSWRSTMERNIQKAREHKDKT